MPQEAPLCLIYDLNSAKKGSDKGDVVEWKIEMEKVSIKVLRNFSQTASLMRLCNQDSRQDVRRHGCRNAAVYKDN